MSAAISSAVVTATDNMFEFVGPILGFEDERQFTLSPLEASGTLWMLKSTRTPELRFVLATPEPFFPSYAPEVDEAILASLAAEELTVLVILTVDGPIRTASANLLAPVVLAPARRRAMQIVLRDDTLPVCAPLQPPPLQPPPLQPPAALDPAAH
jgi:flagellar assembly factor FliW